MAETLLFSWKHKQPERNLIKVPSNEISWIRSVMVRIGFANGKNELH